MLTKLIALDPDETSRRLDAIADAFRVTLSAKLKESAVKQEIEKQEEAVRSVLRVTLLLRALSGGTAGHGLGAGWKTYWEWVEKDFESQLKGLREERRDEY